MKKFKIILYVVLFIAFILLILTIYTSATQNNTEDGKEKTLSEVEYLEVKLEDLFCKINNVEIRNYKIYTTEIEESQSKSEGSSSSAEQNSSSENTSTSNSSSSQSEMENSTTNQDKTTTEAYEMIETGVLTRTEDIDWKTIKNQLELIYTSISTITLDFYNLNMSDDDILNFNKEIDNLTISVESEDKQATLDNLVKVYEYIPKFAQNAITDTLYKTIIDTKLNVFKAYSKLDSEDWDGMSTDITDAINVYSSLLTNAEIEINKQASVNKGYVMLNELKNAVDVKNSSVFLIKYKNLLEEINNM